MKTALLVLAFVIVVPTMVALDRAGYGSWFFHTYSCAYFAIHEPGSPKVKDTEREVGAFPHMETAKNHYVVDDLKTQTSELEAAIQGGFPAPKELDAKNLELRCWISHRSVINSLFGSD
jgi:hypothetical protein